MYKYFKELENPNDFKVYLTKGLLVEERKLYSEKAWLSNDFLKQYKEIFKRINIIDMFIEGTKYELFDKHPSLAINDLVYDECYNMHQFFSLKEEEYPYINIKGKLDLTFYQITSFLRIHLDFCDYLIDIYPQYKEFFLSTLTMINNTLKQLNEKSTMELPPLSNKVEYTYPNAWYITPTGYLYNTGGEYGHKQGNLINSFLRYYESIKNDGYALENANLYNDIKKILKKEYVPWGYYKNYSNTKHRITPIITPEVELDNKREKYIINGRNKEKISHDPFSRPERIYQKNVITLITGYLSAETALANSFARLNHSKKKKEIIEKLTEITRKYLPDILVRYSGFNKIESVLDRTITTSSLKGIENFKEYLDKGWNLHIIPGIVYDKTKDELTEVDFNSCYIERHLDKELSNYTGKGKILIKK